MKSFLFCRPGFRSFGFLSGLFLSFLHFTQGFAAKPHEGRVLKVLVFKDTHSQAVAENVKEFESITGAKVVFDMIASNTMATKTGTDQAAGGTYDLYAVDEPFMPQLSSFFLPVSSWPKPKVIPAAEVALDRFLPAAIHGGEYKGKAYGLPINGNVYVYAVRKDLLGDAAEAKKFKARYGYDLAIPRTTAQLRDVAEFFTRPPRLYGFAPFTKISEGTTVEAMWILSTFGTRILDDELKLVLDVKKATQAFQFYLDLMKFAPPGATAWHHAERMAAYSKGTIAQFMTWPSFIKDLENPDKSLVVGKTACSLPPAGPAGKSSPVAGTWTVAIPRSSKEQALASEFAAWWASSTFGRKLVAHGMNPARRDLLSDPALVKENPWFPHLLASFEVAIVRPRFPAYKQISDAISLHFTNMIAGRETPAAAAAGLHADVSALLAKTRH